MLDADISLGRFPLWVLHFYSIVNTGGIQEESTYLNVPCLTVQENTERPNTVSFGPNQLVGQDMEWLQTKITGILQGQDMPGKTDLYGMPVRVNEAPDYCKNGRKII
jgi:UDP-N-acetylglucosamine 2-epimerase